MVSIYINPNSSDISLLSDDNLAISHMGKLFYIQFVELEYGYHYFNFCFDSFCFSSRPKHKNEIMESLINCGGTKIGIHDIITLYDTKLLYISNQLYQLILYQKITQKTLIYDLRLSTFASCKNTIFTLYFRLAQIIQESRQRNSKLDKKEESYLKEIKHLREALQTKEKEISVLKANFKNYVSSLSIEMEKLKVKYDTLSENYLTLANKKVFESAKLNDSCVSNQKQADKDKIRKNYSYSCQTLNHEMQGSETVDSICKFESVSSSLLIKKVVVRCFVDIDKSTFAFADSKGEIHVKEKLSYETLAIMKSHEMKGEPESKAIYCMLLIDSSTLVTGGKDSLLRIWKLKTFTLEKTLNKHFDCVYCLTKINDKLIASGSYDKTIVIWNIASDRVLITLNKHTGNVYGLLFYNSMIISVSADNTARFWKLADGKSAELEHLSIEEKYSIMSVCNASSFIFLGTSIGDICVWKVNPNKRVTEFKGHKGWVSSIIQISPCCIASASWDSIIQIWDIIKLAPVNMLEGHTGTVLSLIKIEENIILSGSQDSTIRIWTGQ